MPRARIRTRETLADRLATKKRADAYIGRDGQAPNVREAAREGRRQDMNEDDRKHLRFCLAQLRSAVGRDLDRHACLDFVEAILEHDYELSRMRAP
jgi:hypothetical protein